MPSCSLLARPAVKDSPEKTGRFARKSAVDVKGQLVAGSVAEVVRIAAVVAEMLLIGQADSESGNR